MKETMDNIKLVVYVLVLCFFINEMIALVFSPLMLQACLAQGKDVIDVDIFPSIVVRCLPRIYQ